MVCWLMLVVKDDVEVGGGRFPNITLCSSNSGCSSVTEFWLLVFGASHSTSASARDGAAFVESMEGIKVASRV